MTSGGRMTVPLGLEVEKRWPQIHAEERGGLTLETPADLLLDVCRFLADERNCSLATVVAEQPLGDETRFDLTYVFLDRSERRLVKVEARSLEDTVPSITKALHAADWHEREIEDLFGIRFTGHPVLGDFVLHDATWREDVAPMRVSYDRAATVKPGGRRETWRPRTVLRQAGSHALPIGPVYGDVTEAVLFVLESTGEQIRRCVSRPFYKYRGVEKLAEGLSPESAVLLAERFSGGAAFAHSLAFSQAVESLAGVEIPPRAAWLRVLFAELERARSHTSAIAAICGSTALAVAKAQAQLIEEELLRLSAQVAGHRYLFGVCTPGGVTVDLTPDTGALLAARLPEVLKELNSLEQGLRFSSSFLDRLEEVGVLRPELARDYGVVGPVSRASGDDADLRDLLPYAAYRELGLRVASEVEGDGFARLRVLFAEARAALELCVSVARGLPSGPVAVPVNLREGAALGAVEAPAGATYHWVRVGNDGTLLRFHVEPPSLKNVHAFAAAVEGFAFQDFPIILSTFNLSFAESDR